MERTKERQNWQDLRDYNVAGSDTWIYLVENGVNEDHPVRQLYPLH